MFPLRGDDLTNWIEAQLNGHRLPRCKENMTRIFKRRKLTMDEAKRKANARERLLKICPKGTVLNIIRIDEGRTAQTLFYAVMVVEDGKLTNISPQVARVIDRKWSNVNWANSSGVAHRNPQDLIEQLAGELYDAYKAKEVSECFTLNEL